jgi:hypothetical protein
MDVNNKVLTTYRGNSCSIEKELPLQGEQSETRSIAPRATFLLCAKRLVIPRQNIEYDFACLRSSYNNSRFSVDSAVRLKSTKVLKWKSLVKRRIRKFF